MVIYVIRWCKVYYGTFFHQTNNREKNLEYEQDHITKLKLRIQEDNKNIRKVCAKYLDSKDPRLPIQPKSSIQYYFLDDIKKLGWCVNAKVYVHFYMSINVF